jgi:aryl-alcohol dehydrogenase-like predicted oxidoreductase
VSGESAWQSITFYRPSREADQGAALGPANRVARRAQEMARSREETLMSMPLSPRAIGPFTVSPIGLGCMNIAHAYKPAPDRREAERLLLHALDSGVDFFDTAALYGDSEAIIGDTLMDWRDEFILASKCGLGAPGGGRTIDGSPATILKTLDASLRSLKTDYIDLYYLHRIDPMVAVEDSIGALARAVEAGKIRAIGLSEVSAATLRRAHAVHPIAAVQSEYSPYSRNPEIAVLDACADLGVGFVAFSPLGRGMLTPGFASRTLAAGDVRRYLPRFQPPHSDRNLALAASFADIAQDAGCSMPQLALHWCLARRPFVTAIPGTTSCDHLDDNLGALALPLDAAYCERIDALFDRHAVSGPRYPAQGQAQIDTETWPDEPL